VEKIRNPFESNQIHSIIVRFDTSKLIPDVSGYILKYHPLSEIYTIQQIA